MHTTQQQANQKLSPRNEKIWHLDSDTLDPKIVLKFQKNKNQYRQQQKYFELHCKKP